MKSLINIFLLIILLSANASYSSSAQTLPESTATVPEGNDYATQILGDAWDMSQFSDISEYLNQSGQDTFISNFRVENGIFSGQTAQNMAQFSILFPGYKNALLVGKVGHKYPIDANKYKCIYVAAKVDSMPQSGGPDQMAFIWFANENLNSPGGIWGETIPGAVLSPGWHLFTKNLANAKTVGNGPWSQAPNGQWQGLMVVPTTQKTTFQVDWIRLTDCSAVNMPISWSGTGQVSVSIRPDGTTNDISVLQNTSANPINLDVQGYQAGKYTYYVKQGTTTLVSGSFKVNDAPILSIKTPSTTSGVDYATQAGKAYDMDPGDIASTTCFSNSWFDSGVFYFDTPSVEYQPPSCKGGGFNDPGIFFKSFAPVDTSQFRYLTFEMYTSGSYQNVPQAMIVRFFWILDNQCNIITYGIPSDVGWHTYSIDLWDSTEGLAEDYSKSGCPSPPLTWLNSSAAFVLRFKPNENISGQTLTQGLDWVRLTKMDRVQIGQTYQIQITTSKVLPSSQISFFYTDNLASPQQHPVQTANAVQPNSVHRGPYSIFLPSSVNVYRPDVLSFSWNTNGVAAGVYYICAKASDGYNSTLSCSDAQVTVTP